MQLSQITEGKGKAGIALTKVLTPNGKRLLKNRNRFLISSLGAVEFRQVIESQGDVRMGLPQSLPPYRQGFLNQRQCFVIATRLIQLDSPVDLAHQPVLKLAVGCGWGTVGGLGWGKVGFG
jgi:hypothetical protein